MSIMLFPTKNLIAAVRGQNNPITCSTRQITKIVSQGSKLLSVNSESKIGGGGLVDFERDARLNKGLNKCEKEINSLVRVRMD